MSGWRRWFPPDIRAEKTDRYTPSGTEPMTDAAQQEPVCVVAGVGPGNGEAFARQFAAQGYKVGLLSRRKDRIGALSAELRHSRAVVCDVTDAKSLENAFVEIETELGPVEVLIYNAGQAVWGDVESVTAAEFEEAWRVNTLGLFLAARQTIRGFTTCDLATTETSRGFRGAIVVVGATASLRGAAGTAAFAPAKAAQRSLTQSLARYLWPKGIHVSLIIIDGIVDSPGAREMFPGRPDQFFVKPTAVAKIALELVCQDPSAWSFEVEARPFAEKW